MTFYNSLAKNYEKIAKKKKKYLRSVDLILKRFIKNKKYILDAGSGDGLRLSKIRSRYKNKKFYAIEPSNEMFKLLKKNKGIFCRKMALQDIHKLKKKFDAILCLWNVLGHLKDNYERVRVLKKIKKCMNKNSVLIFDVNNRHNALAYGYLNVFFRLIVDMVSFKETRGDTVYFFNEGKKKIKASGHLFIYSELKNIINQAKLKIKKVYFINYENGKIVKSKYFGQMLFILEQYDK